MERTSCSCALRVLMVAAVSSLRKGFVSEGENEGAGGSCTRDNAIGHCTFLLCRVGMGRGIRVEVGVRAKTNG